MATILANSNAILARLGITAGEGNPDRDLVVGDLWPAMEAAVKQYLGYDPTARTVTEYLPSRDGSMMEEPLDPMYAKTSAGSLVLENGGGSNPDIFVSSLPLRSVTSLYENPGAWEGGTSGGDWPASTLLREGSDFIVDYSEPGLSMSGCIRRRAGSWSAQRRSVKVTYAAGLSADELAGDYYPIRDALMLAIQRRFLSIVSLRKSSVTGAAGGIVSAETIGDWSVQYDSASLQAMGLGMAISLPEEARDMLRPFALLPMR